MVAGRLILAVLAATFSVAAVSADLKLPQSREDYKKLSESVEATPVADRHGVVQRVTVVKKARKAASPMDQPAARTSADIVSDRTLVATPAIGKGAADARAALDEAPMTEYQVAIRWGDGSIGIVRQEHDPKLKKGDAVAVKDGKLSRIAP